MTEEKPAEARIAGAAWRAIGAFALALAWLMAPATAAAQTRSVETATAPARAVVLNPLTFINTRSMDFGKIATTGAGTVTINSSTGTCTASAGVLRIGICQPAEFMGRGVANLIVRIRVNETQINLNPISGTGTSMRLDNFTVDGLPGLLYIGAPGNPRYRILTSSGIFTFRVGGRLNVNAGQAPGTYRGTFSVRADYL